MRRSLTAICLTVMVLGMAHSIAYAQCQMGQGSGFNSIITDTVIGTSFTPTCNGYVRNWYVQSSSSWSSDMVVKLYSGQSVAAGDLLETYNFTGLNFSLASTFINFTGQTALLTSGSVYTLTLERSDAGLFTLRHVSGGTYADGQAYTASGSFIAADDMYTAIIVGTTTPAVTTQAVTAIAATSATGNGNITSLGLPAATQHGVCWNTSGTPTLADTCTEEGAPASTGAFTSSITGLTEGTLYYVRAYATNAGGAGYGGQVSFTALEPPLTTPVPTLSEWA